MNTLDIIVLVVVLLSAGLAFARGFIREVLSIITWLGAVAIAYYGYRYAAPFTEHFLPRGPFANGAAAAGVFIVALIVLSLITGAIGSRVSQSKLSSFDRILGLIFGLVRGAVLVSLGFIALIWAYPADKQPDWVKAARTRPLLEVGKNMIEDFMPSTWRDKAESTANSARQTVDTATEAENAMRALSVPKSDTKKDSAPPASYNKSDRRDMDRLIQQGQ